MSLTKSIQSFTKTIPAVWSLLFLLIVLLSGSATSIISQIRDGKAGGVDDDVPVDFHKAETTSIQVEQVATNMFKVPWRTWPSQPPRIHLPRPSSVSKMINIPIGHSKKQSQHINLKNDDQDQRSNMKLESPSNNFSMLQSTIVVERHEIQFLNPSINQSEDRNNNDNNDHHPKRWYIDDFGPLNDRGHGHDDKNAIRTMSTQLIYRSLEERENMALNDSPPSSQPSSSLLLLNLVGKWPSLRKDNESVGRALPSRSSTWLNDENDNFNATNYNRTIIPLQFFTEREKIFKDGKNDSTLKNLIIPSIFIIVIILTMVLIILHQLLFSETEGFAVHREPEEQINMILCMPENALFEYNLIFRVGCPTKEFDMENSYIDYEILGPKDEIIGSPVRFDCSLLPDIICGEMHCFIGRITPMPPINGIRANHSTRNPDYRSRNTAIFFYEYELIDLKITQTIERRLIMDYIQTKQKIFRGRVAPAETTEKDLAILGPWGLMEPPVVEMSLIEVSITISMILMLSGLFIILFETSEYYIFCQNEDGSLFRSIQDVLFVVPIMLLIILLHVVLYKYNIKRSATLQRYRGSGQANYQKLGFWKRFSTAYLGLMIMLVLAAAGFIIYFSLKITLALSIYWLTTTILVSTISIGTWACCNKSNILNQYYSQSNPENSQFLQTMTEGKHGHEKDHRTSLQDRFSFQSTKRYRASDVEHTLYFPPKTLDRINTAGISKSDGNAIIPKLVNPNRSKGSKKRKRSRKKLP